MYISKYRISFLKIACVAKRGAREDEKSEIGHKNLNREDQNGARKNQFHGRKLPPDEREHLFRGKDHLEVAGEYPPVPRALHGD